MDELFNIVLRYPEWDVGVQFDEPARAYVITFRTNLATSDGGKHVKLDRYINIRMMSDSRDSKGFVRDQIIQLEQAFAFELDNIRAQLKAEDKIP